ncbi:MAG: response regulator [Nitrospirota bacterium]
MSAKILVADDTGENRALLKDVLMYYGYEVIEAQDGAEAVRLTKERMPALILMDVQMPVMNGIEALKLLRADPETRNIKIISLTAFAVDMEMGQFLNAGFDDYISKPIDIRMLLAMIQKHLGGTEGRPPLFEKGSPSSPPFNKGGRGGI